MNDHRCLNDKYSLKLETINDPSIISVRKSEMFVLGYSVWSKVLIRIEKKKKCFNFIYCFSSVYFSRFFSSLHCFLFQVAGDIPSFPTELSSTVINGSRPWTRCKMRDFFLPCLSVCVAARLRRSLSWGMEAQRPTRRPPIASAPCLKSLPECHLPCSHMQHQHTQQQRAKKQLVRLQHCVDGHIRVMLHRQQCFSSTALCFYFICTKLLVKLWLPLVIIVVCVGPLTAQKTYLL